MENKQESIFCVNCGSKLEEPVKRKKPLYKKKWFWVLMSIATSLHLIISLIFIAAVGSVDLETTEYIGTTTTVKNFRELFSEYEEYDWCTIGWNGRSMKLDDNPHNYAFSSNAYWRWWEASQNSDFDSTLASVNEALDLPTDIIDKMVEDDVTHIGGTYENKNYRVSWKWKLVISSEPYFIEYLYEMK